MRIVHAIMVITLSALLLGLVIGVASASVPGVAINAPPPPSASGPATSDSDQAISIMSETYGIFVYAEAAMASPTGKVTSGPPGTGYGMGGGPESAGGLKVSPKPSPTITPKTTVMPSPTKRSMLAAGGMANPTSVIPSPTVSFKPRPSRQTRMLAVSGPQASPAASVGMTPAESYGIYGRGGVMPSPAGKPSPTHTAPTPPPGLYTPRFPGEVGYKGNATVSPTAKASPTIKRLVVRGTSVKPSPTMVSATPKPTVKRALYNPVDESYGIGQGKKAPSPSPPVKVGSITPPPGGYTPKFPGEPGYKGNATVSPTATVRR